MRFGYNVTSHFLLNNREIVKKFLFCPHFIKICPKNCPNDKCDNHAGYRRVIVKGKQFVIHLKLYPKILNAVYDNFTLKNALGTLRKDCIFLYLCYSCRSRIHGQGFCFQRHTCKESVKHLMKSPVESPSTGLYHYQK